MSPTGLETVLISALGKQLEARILKEILDAAYDVAGSLLGIQEDTETTSKTLKRLIQKYYTVGQRYLEYAINSDLESDRRSHLKDAIREFTNAAQLDSMDVTVSSKLLIAACFRVLGDDSNADKCLAETYTYMYKNSQSIIDARGRVIAESLGINYKTLGTFNQKNDVKLIEIYTDEAEDFYSELNDVASILEDNGYKVKRLSKETAVAAVHANYKKLADLSYQRSRGM